nr:hypothetical protein [Streptococcus gallolyticus]
MTITVYLASSMGNTPDYHEQVVVFANWLAQHAHCLVYGGSKTRLMEVLADTVLV